MKIQVVVDIIMKTTDDLRAIQQTSFEQHFRKFEAMGEMHLSCKSWNKVNIDKFWKFSEQTS